MVQRPPFELRRAFVINLLESTIAQPSAGVIRGVCWRKVISRCGSRDQAPAVDSLEFVDIGDALPRSAAERLLDLVVLAERDICAALELLCHHVRFEDERQLRIITSDPKIVNGASREEMGSTPNELLRWSTWMR